MSLSFTSSTGNLFNQVGRIGGVALDIVQFCGSSAPASSTTWGSAGVTIACIQDAIEDVRAQVAGNANTKKLEDNLFTNKENFRAACSTGLVAQMQTLAQSVVQTIVNADVLNTPTYQSALVNLVAQMTSQSYKVTAPTTSVSVGSLTSGVSSAADGVVVSSLKNGSGITTNYAYAETVYATVTADSQTGSATVGNETITFTGATPNLSGSMLREDWPGGSGCSVTFTAISTATGGGSVLQDGSFATWAGSPAAATYWPIGSVGAYGTDVLQEASVVYDGTYSLRFKGDGSTLDEVYQVLTGLLPNTVYAFSAYIRKSSSIAAGVLSASLTDGSGTVQNDAAGTANTITVAYNASGISSSTFKALWNGFFRTPPIMPTVLRLRLKVTTAITNGESLYVARVALAPATQLYAGGPYVAAFSGYTKWITTDYYALTVSNDYAGVMQHLFWRFFNMPALGLQLPTSGSNTVADSLVAP